MNGRQLFVSGCRILGVYVLWSGGEHLVTLVNVVTHFYRPDLSTSAAFATHAVFDLVVGTYLLGAEGLARLVYGKSEPPA